MRGRKPLPTWRKRLEGNPGRRPLNDHEPSPPTAGTFDVPPEVAAVPRALVEWERLAPMLRATRQVTEADRGALMALCLEFARYLQALQHVNTAGLIVLAPSGYPMPNPYIAIATKALSGCTKLWAELGLTPSSRSRVVAPDGPSVPDDPFKEFDQPTTH